MRMAVAVLLLAGVAGADSRVDRMIEHLRAGRTGKALAEVSPPVRQLLAYGMMTRELFWAMSEHNDRLARKDEAACRKVVELARSIGQEAVAQRPDYAPSRILVAESLLVEGRFRRARKEDGWIESWREAARTLAEFDGSGHAVARMRAVEILAEGAALDRAAADDLLAEARTAAGDESWTSPAWLAYRYQLALHHVRAGKSAAARTALETFRGLGDHLDDTKLELSGYYNLALSLSRRHGLGLEGDFVTTLEVAGRISIALPVSHLWSRPREHWDDGGVIEQEAPDGRPLRRIYLNWYEPGNRWSRDRPAPRSTKELAGLRLAQIKADFARVKRKKGPRKGRFNEHLKSGMLFTIEGRDEAGAPRAALHFFFEDDRGGGFFEASTTTYGDLPDDPLFEETVGSVR